MLKKGIIMSWTYEAKQNERGIGGVECKITLEDGSVKFLTNLGYHSPDGFQIGYGGSGPADLAYSVLMDFMLRSKKCETKNVAGKVEFLHQLFKTSFVETSKELFQIDSDCINEWLVEQENNQEREEND